MGVSALASKISSVRVIDARYDTNALGYYSAAGFTNYNYKSTWPKIYCIDSSLATNIGIAKWVSNYLQLRYATSSNGSLLVVLKKFWISPDAAPILYDNNKLGQPLEGSDAGIISKLEFYLQKENAFYPLFRLDSIFTFKDKLPDSASKFIKAALKNSLKFL
ncbi:MAG: hypothetical protein IPP48_10820 [Chitinophagaceae bacterium]|nr:hypothetical protein [Chitinophagaceae bacterium]